MLDSINSANQKIALIDLTPINIPTGQVVADLSDYNIGEDALPGEARASLGTKWYIDREKLNPMRACKKRLTHWLSKHGVRQYGGRAYAIPLGLLDSFTEVAEKEKVEFDKVAERNASNLESDINEWCGKFGKHADQLRACAPTPAEFRERCNFDWSVSQQQLIDEKHTGISMSDQLMYEIRRDAQVIFRESFEGKTSVTRRAVNPMIGLVEKLEGLAFINSDATPIAQATRQSLSQLPPKGPYEGAELFFLQKIIENLMAWSKDPLNFDTIQKTLFMKPTETSAKEEESIPAPEPALMDPPSANLTLGCFAI